MSKFDQDWLYEAFVLEEELNKLAFQSASEHKLEKIKQGQVLGRAGMNE